MLESPDYFFRVREIGRLRQTTRMYGRPMEGALDLRNGRVSEKTPQIFLTSLRFEYVTAFSRRTDALKLSYRLTEGQTDTTTTVTLGAHAQRGLQ